MFRPYHGKNRYRTFLKAGKTVAGKIAKLDGVIGILGTGAIGRCFADVYSDLDMLVYAQRATVKRLRRVVSVGWTGYKGMDFDIEVLSYERARAAKVPSAFWGQVERWDLQNSRILYDSQDKIARLLQEKLVYPDWEQKRLLQKYEMEVHEYLVFFPELWAERGELYNVAHSLHRAVEGIVLWIYAKNKVFQPYTGKWLFYHLENHTVPEHVHLPVLAGFYSASIANLRSAFQFRAKLLRLCDLIDLKWEVYSCPEAHERCQENWKKASAETKRVLSW